MDINKEKNVPTRKEIEQRAYEIYLERGREEGRAEEHWLAAEKELTARKPVSIGPKTYPTEEKQQTGRSWTPEKRAAGGSR